MVFTKSKIESIDQAFLLANLKLLKHMNMVVESISSHHLEVKILNIKNISKNT